MQLEFWKGCKVCVTGGDGFLGKHLVRKLKEKKAVVFIPTIEEYDLRKMEDCQKSVEGQEVVIHLAGVLGGEEFNREQQGRIYFDNVSMNTNTMEAARQKGVKKFVSISSTSAYPKNAKNPLKEENMFDGPPEKIKEAYCFSKRMLVVQSKAYKQQYDFNAITLILSNLYGPGDKFDEKTAHVIPALIVKHFKNHEIEICGSPESSRNFLYVEDAADAIILAAEKYDSPEPMNISSPEEIKIKDLVKIIGKHTNFKGRIAWPDAKSVSSKKAVDTSKAKNILGFETKTSIEEGIKKTIGWYRTQLKRLISNL